MHPIDHFFQELLAQLFRLPLFYAALSFLLENMFIVALVLISGRLIQKWVSPHALPYAYTAQEWKLCAVTVVLNTAVTFLGFWLWEQQYIIFQLSCSWYIITDFLLLFLAMDFLMYVFHFFIHKTSLYKMMHSLHHEAVNPTPIHLFVLHPVETICFGLLWLSLLFVYNFNFYSIVIYLTINVLFGMVGHLGLEPLSESLRRHPFAKWLGTSTFHHDHHQYTDYNFGFYTTIWDIVFKTLKR